MAARRFFLVSLALAALGLGAIGAFNYRVDPFQQYRMPSTYDTRYYNAFQRFQNPGLARLETYDRVTIGSSMTENISRSEVDRAFGSGRTINLALSAMTAYDARRLLEVALARGQVKQVLYTLDFNAFSGAPDRTGFPDPLPAYLYDDARWNDYPYLLSSATTKKSLEIATARRVNRYSTDADRPWAWAHEATFGRKAVVASLDPANLNRRFKQPPRTIEEMMRSFEANVLPVVQAHPQTQFVYIWPPYSILVWADFHQRGQLDVSLEFKRRFHERLRPHANTRILDFQARTDVITDLDRYSDIYHYGPDVSSALVQWVARGEGRITEANLEAELARQRSMAVGTDPARIVAEALR